MTGLEKITTKIQKDSLEEYEGIIQDAKAQAKKLHQETLLQIEEERQHIMQKALEEGNRDIGIAKSSAIASENRAILSAKADVIELIVQKAFDKIDELPDAEYFTLLRRLIKNVEKKDGGELLFNERDLKRLPKSFLEEVNQDVAPFSFTIAKETAMIRSGFVLSYGETEFNCSFEALFEFDADYIRDELSILLF